MKKYIWGFPGMGKSYINNEKIVDVDCEQFKYIFPNGVPDNLHRSGEWEGVLRNPEYPENYFKYIESLGADIVLLNCHISLLERLDKERVLLVYPCGELFTEYRKRYKDRGDNESFISYMTAEFEGMIQHIDSLNYKKYKVFSENTYLSDLFERNDFKVKIMTRDEITKHLQRAIDLNVLDLNFDGDIVCDISKATAANFSSQVYNASDLAEDVLNGVYGLDIDQLNKVCAEREAQIEKEKVFTERRGGLSREELEDKIMQGIVNGALGIRYAEIAPYSHGYEVTFGSDGPVGSTWKFKNRWECYCSLFEIPGKIVSMIENDRQDNEVFGEKTKPLDIQELLRAVDEMEGKQITSFTPEKDTNFERHNYPHNIGSVASVMDVHAGKGLDGIVQHHYHGTYSTMTPGKQNELVESLVFLKGFCLDYFYEQNLRKHNGIYSDDCKGIVEYLKKHGTDISTPEKLQEWIKANPEKCGKEENRALSLEKQRELYAQAYCEFIELKSIVDTYTGSLEKLCDKLGGRDFDGDFFDVSFGSLDATISCRDGKFVLNDGHIGIWNASKTAWVEENVSLEYLKDTCEEIGYSIDALEAKALDKSKDEISSLDEQIAKCEAQKEPADPISKALERGEFR